MTVQLPLQEGLLSLEQWQRLEALASGLSPQQARWISGYFAGLDAGLLRGGGVEPSSVSKRGARSLTILYGTETGNSRELAKALALDVGGRGLAATLCDLADYKFRQLKDEQDIVLIVSTYGEGDPPQPSTGFFEYLEGPRAPRLDHVRFSVLALGDSTYEHYCEAGKRVDRRLEELGATRLGPRVDCDVDYDDPAATWSAALIDLLTADLRIEPDVAGAPRAPALPSTLHDRHNPFPSRLLENIAIVGRRSTKQTRHVELDLSGSGLTYQPGDALGFAASNDAQLVEQLLEATGLSGEVEVRVKSSSMSLAAALTSRFEIATGSPRFLEQWARLSGSRELQDLTAPDHGAERVRFLRSHHITDIVRRFPAEALDATALLAGLRPLQPRLYSIASSQAAVGEEAHLTVAPVRYVLHGSRRGGVASTQIADRLEIGDTIPVYVQENPHFRLPADDVPVIMVGPGTGVAPFRAFLQEREARASRGRSWLLFGERNRQSDFLYQLELQRWLKDGLLTRLDVAFSRDTDDKVYVQHRMLEQKKQLYAWLEEGAHFYVCGDEKAMARDVHDALVSLVASEASVSGQAAHDYVARLACDHRYQRDTY